MHPRRAASHATRCAPSPSRRRPRLTPQWVSTWPSLSHAPATARVPASTCSEPAANAYNPTGPAQSNATHTHWPPRHSQEQLLTHLPHHRTTAPRPHARHSAHPSRQSLITTLRPQTLATIGHTHLCDPDPNQRRAQCYHKHHSPGLQARQPRCSAAPDPPPTTAPNRRPTQRPQSGPPATPSRATSAPPPLLVTPRAVPYTRAHPHHYQAQHQTR